MLHFDNFLVHQADWTSRNTYDSRGFFNKIFSLLLSSKNREFLIYYDIERDKFSRIFNVPGIPAVLTRPQATRS